MDFVRLRVEFIRPVSAKCDRYIKTYRRNRTIENM